MKMTIRLASGARDLRRRVASALNHAQLGPSREREWLTFSPGRSTTHR
jgi:hypothetical protein